MRSIYIFVITIFVIIFAFASPADAQNDQKAKSFFDQGVSAFNNQDYNAALNAFQQSYQTSPHWSMFYHIGNCYAYLKQPNNAAKSYQQFIDEGGAEANPQEFKSAQSAIENIKKTTGILVLKILPDGTGVTIDGESIGASPVNPVLLTPGLHNIILMRSNLGAEQIEVEAHAQEELTVTADPEIGYATTSITKPMPAPESTNTIAGLSVTTNIQGATVEIDGHLAGTTPFKTNVPAGEHHMVIHSDTYVNFDEQIILTSGNRNMYDITMRNENEKPKRLSIPFFIAAGVGALGLVIAVPGFIAYGSRGREIEDTEQYIDALLDKSGNGNLAWDSTCAGVTDQSQFSGDEEDFCETTWDLMTLKGSEKGSQQRAAGWAVTGTIFTVLGASAAAVLYFKPEWILKSKSTADITISPLVSNNQSGLILSGSF